VTDEKNFAHLWRWNDLGAHAQLMASSAWFDRYEHGVNCGEGFRIVKL
jgi:hypothetical protein